MIERRRTQLSKSGSVPGPISFMILKAPDVEGFIITPFYFQ
jgi:hypothetical protein